MNVWIYDSLVDSFWYNRRRVNKRVNDMQAKRRVSVRRKAPTSRVEDYAEQRSVSLADAKTQHLQIMLRESLELLQKTKAELASLEVENKYNRGRFEEYYEESKRFRKMLEKNTHASRDSLQKMIGLITHAFRNGLVNADTMIDENGELDDVKIDLAESQYRMAITKDRAFRQQVERIAVGLASELGLSDQGVGGDF
jgi:hypothetical protein